MVARAVLALQNPFCAVARVDGSLVARQGAMVAPRGDLRIQTKGQGLKKLLKRAATGEGVALMEVSGSGDIWLADQARNSKAAAWPAAGCFTASSRAVAGSPSRATASRS